MVFHCHLTDTKFYAQTECKLNIIMHDALNRAMMFYCHLNDHLNDADKI